MTPPRDPSEELLTVQEVAEHCGVGLDLIEELIRHGLVEVVEQQPRRVHAEVTLRVQTVVRLRRDLGVNAAGAAVIVELLERIARLEHELRHR